MKRYDVLNYLAEVRGYDRYLEIGVRVSAECFDKIRCSYKIGVDPDKKSDATYQVTSDEYFSMTQDEFDLIFIDGLHVYENVMNDVTNALDVLLPGGTIVLHDCNPKSEWLQRSYEQYLRHRGHWNGTVWKAFVELRRRCWLFMYTVDTDEGIGIIRQGYQAPLSVTIKDYPTFDKYRHHALNLVSINTFTKMEQQLVDLGL